jgi:glyoxylase-like metal-dependent hydrolase (beta-lactamase superfamily II)
VVQQLSPLVRRVLANNPGPLTHTGTGTFIVGSGTVAVIDPGPDLPKHVAALAQALAGETVSHIIVTHEHKDHVGAVPAFAELTAAPVLGYTRPLRLLEGESVEGPGWSLEAIHTPGHVMNHLCLVLAEEETIFSGDHIMGWSTTMIVPPDGDMLDYMGSLELMMRRPEKLFRPTHGAAIPDGPDYAGHLLAHRRLRASKLVEAISKGARDLASLMLVTYPGVGPGLERAARMTLEAHLAALVLQGRIVERDGYYRTTGIDWKN